jgi:hypothetical protein
MSAVEEISLSHESGPAPDQLVLAQRLNDLITASWTSQAVYVAAELGLAELLAGGARTCTDLANATQTDEPSLRRLLRALTTIGLCEEVAGGAFRMTDLGALLAADAPASLRSWAIWWGGHLWPTWSQLLYSVKTGRSARARQTGADGFGHLEHNAVAAETFNRALVELTRLSADEVVRACDFAGTPRIVDVGGGYGELLSAILRVHSGVRGVLFDLPHAIDGAKAHLADAGVGDRCEVIAGDFFESVPSGGDVYILKTVIHDWSDTDAVRILKACHRAMTHERRRLPDGSASRLLIIDRVLPDRMGAADQALARSDLTMLIAHSGLERTLDQFRQVLGAAGLRVVRSAPAGVLTVIEAVPAGTDLQ